MLTRFVVCSVLLAASFPALAMSDQEHAIALLTMTAFVTRDCPAYSINQVRLSFAMASFGVDFEAIPVELASIATQKALVMEEKGMSNQLCTLALTMYGPDGDVIPGIVEGRD